MISDTDKNICDEDVSFHLTQNVKRWRLEDSDFVALVCCATNRVLAIIPLGCNSGSTSLQWLM